MRLDDQRESSNIEDQRGRGGFGGMGGPGFGMRGGGGGLGGMLGLLFAARGLGIWGILGVLGLWLFLGGGCQALFGSGPGTTTGPGAGVGPSATGTAVPGAAAPAANQTDSFVRRVLATTEDTWSRQFAAQGSDYPEPTLVFYSGIGQSGCGVAQAAVGPFYCPSDRKIYLDTSFFDELARRFGAPGDFAAAYVIAHEVGHHVQTVTGVSDQVRRMQARASQAEQNAIQVRMELQADCYAGVWGHDNKALLEAGDVEEAMRAAAAIGDDRLQEQSGRRVRPESFTHGSSEQRMRWFNRGFTSGDPAQCDTFSSQAL